MDADMSNYPPPDQQYSSAYPAATAPPQQSPDTAIEQLQSSLEQQHPGYGSVEFGRRVQDTLAELENAAKRATEVTDGDLVEQQAGVGPTASSSAEPSPRTNRLRKACDSCSIRKVKCDESGPPCRACANLEIPCTFDRPSRRRGPPNRHAEMIKRRRLEADNGSADYIGSSAHAAEALAALGGAALSAQQQTFSADSIAPRDIVQRLVHDYFTYVHPLAPFPHEPMFMSAFHQRQDATNKIFVAMLAAMVGTVVAAYPKRLRTHYRALGYQRVEPAEPFVQNCLNICISSRGAGYLDRPEFDVNTYDAITSYLVGQIYLQKNLLRQGCRYFAESLAILRGCGLQSPPNSTIKQAQLNPLNKDFVHQELAQRLWWRLYIISKQMTQARTECPELEFALSGPTPPLPTERDDAYIFTDNYDDQPYGVTSELTGFRIYLNVYQASGDLEAVNLLNTPEGTPDYKQRRAIIKETLSNVKQIQNLPEPPNNPYEQLQQYLNGRPPGGDEAREEQRTMQVTVQRAMIDMAILSTRFQVVEAFWRVDDAQKSDEKDQERIELQLQMKEERVHIVKDLIQLLARVSQTMVESGLDQFAEQFKRLAKALSERQPERKAKQLPEDVAWLTRIINLVERVQKVSNQVEGTFSDEYETLTWSDWREFSTLYLPGDINAY